MLVHNRMLALEGTDYEVCIDSTLTNGSLSYGEYYLRSRPAKEVLFSCHGCHPSLADDNLSGLSVATFPGAIIIQAGSPEFTIGAITWLAQDCDRVARIDQGLVLTCVGDSGAFRYKRSRRGNAVIDRAVAQALRHCGEPFEILEFSPYCYDQRQCCAPGFNLPVGCLMRSVWGTFPEYHTSADNLDFIRPAKLAGSLRLCSAIVDVLENDRHYCDQNPYCEPQLGVGICTDLLVGMHSRMKFPRGCES